jgi:hypothetical protein
VRLEHPARDLARGQQDVDLDLAVGEVHRSSRSQSRVVEK